MITWNNLFFINSNSPLIEQIIFFHDHSIIIITLIIIFIFYLIINILYNKLINRFLLENHDIELIWTIAPSLILLFIAFPSLQLLYIIEEIINPSIRLKITGHQWYWSYSYSNFNINFDSFIIPQENILKNNFRLLDTDSRVIIPYNIYLRILITSNDVIHAWTIPSLGLKIDAVPGRLNQLLIIINRPGIFYGQCSEICGTNHRFIPISIEIIPIKNFIQWIISK